MEFLTAITFVKDQILLDPRVITITHGTSDTIDLDKKTVYPLVHVQCTNSAIGKGVIVFSYELHFLVIRDICKTVIKDKWLGNDNEFENMDLTFNIVNLFVSRLKLQRNDLDIEILNIAQPEPMTFAFANLLDGWRLTFDLEIGNSIVVC